MDTLEQRLQMVARRMVGGNKSGHGGGDAMGGGAAAGGRGEAGHGALLVGGAFGDAGAHSFDGLGAYGYGVKAEGGAGASGAGFASPGSGEPGGALDFTTGAHGTGGGGVKLEGNGLGVSLGAGALAGAGGQVAGSQLFRSVPGYDAQVRAARPPAAPGCPAAPLAPGACLRDRAPRLPGKGACCAQGFSRAPSSSIVHAASRLCRPVPSRMHPLPARSRR